MWSSWETKWNSNTYLPGKTTLWFSRFTNEFKVLFLAVISLQLTFSSMLGCCQQHNSYYRYPRIFFSCSLFSFVLYIFIDHINSVFLFITHFIHHCRKSEVNVIDAKTMSADPVAVVELPQRVPFGFHAFFVTEVS